MEFDLPTTAAVFIALIAIGIGGLAASGVMAADIVLMMVLPTTVAFGLVCLILGVKYGQYRAAR